jgi:hypothetical protein
MKKYIIASFFVLVFLLTFGIVYSYRVVTMPEEEISFETYKDRLSDTEIEEYNRKKTFQTPITPQEGYWNIRHDEVKITRKRTEYGWETKIDTLKSYILKEKCGC